jgi:hypothetical protein
MIVTDISTDPIDLCERDEELVSLRVVQLHIFALYLTESFFHDRVEQGDPMFTVHDIVSGLQSEEEIQMLGDRLFGTLFDKNLRQEIISDDKFSLIIYGPHATHESR